MQGVNSPLGSPDLLRQDSLETMSGTSARKIDGPEMDESVVAKRRIDIPPEIEDVKDLGLLVHGELEVLRNILEADKAAKRITVGQRKELQGSYNRIVSLTRDIVHEHGILLGENNQLKRRIEDFSISGTPF